MARLARVVVPGTPHHVTQRGNRREDVFFSDADRQKYLMLLLDRSQQYGLSVLAYCLMSNHVHLIVVPEQADSLGRAMRTLNSAYAAYVNRRQGYCGHLWQGRFYSCPMDDEHLWTAIRYVERNPVRAKMARRAQDYPWSSAAGHCRLRNDPIIAEGLPQPRWMSDWSSWLAGEDAEQVAEIRVRTRTGRPWGPGEFIRKLEALLDRSLTPKKRGRKPKKKRTNAN